nr:immunoglobulin light chain junction region [Macaca mulatta]
DYYCCSDAGIYTWVF